LNFFLITVRSFQPLPLSQSVETTNSTVDDWFAPTSDPQKSSSQKPDDVITPTTGSTTFRRNLFQANNDIVEHRPPIRPLVSTDDDDETKAKRLTTPRISESGMFARSPDSKLRRSSSTRSTPSPKKHQTEPQLSSTNTRRMSDWSVREHSPDDSDEN
jgi:hypothetical protein